MKKKNRSKSDVTKKLLKQLKEIFQIAMAQENLTLALKAIELQMKIHGLIFKNTQPPLPADRLNVMEWSDEEIDVALKSIPS